MNQYTEAFSVSDKILAEMLYQVYGDEQLTEDFKDFMSQVVMAIKLCQIYEKGTGKIITLDKECRIMEFIKDISPIVEGKGGELPKEKNIIKSIIKDFYIPVYRDAIKMENDDV